MEFFKRNNFDLDLSEFRLIWAGATPIMVPNNFSTMQEKYLKASQLTLAFGNKSVDYILKNYIENFESIKNQDAKDPKFLLLDEILVFSKKQTSKLAKRLERLNFSNGTVSSLACEAVFSRLQTTIKSINYHVKYGFYYESCALIRLFLEQVAYAYTASNVSDEEVDEFISPTKSINELKKFLPKAGHLYGLLSKMSHLDKTTISKYLIIEDEKPTVLLNSIYFSLEVSLCYLEVLEYQNIVFEYSFRKYINEFQFLNIESGSYSPKDFFDEREQKKQFIESIMKLIKD